MEMSYQQSIFTYELENILKSHQLSILALKRSPFVFESRKVDRLLTSLTSLKPLSALNQVEIITVVQKLKLNDDEFQRIFAALVALGVQSLMSGYLSEERAWKIANEVHLAVIELQHKDSTLSDGPLQRIPLPQSVLLPVTETEEASVLVKTLERALDNYDMGMRLITLGQLNANGEEGRLLIGQGYFYLQNAARQLDMLAASGNVLVDEWQNEVQKQLVEAEEESD